MPTIVRKFLLGTSVDPQSNFARRQPFWHDRKTWFRANLDNWLRVHAPLFRRVTILPFPVSSFFPSPLFSSPSILTLLLPLPFLEFYARGSMLFHPNDARELINYRAGAKKAKRWIPVLLRPAFRKISEKTLRRKIRTTEIIRDRRSQHYVQHVICTRNYAIVYV